MLDSSNESIAALVHGTLKSMGGPVGMLAMKRRGLLDVGGTSGGDGPRRIFKMTAGEAGAPQSTRAPAPVAGNAGNAQPADEEEGGIGLWGVLGLLAVLGVVGWLLFGGRGGSGGQGPQKAGRVTIGGD